MRTACNTYGKPRQVSALGGKDKGGMCRRRHLKLHDVEHVLVGLRTRLFIGSLCGPVRSVADGLDDRVQQRLASARSLNVIQWCLHVWTPHGVSHCATVKIGGKRFGTLRKPFSIISERQLTAMCVTSRM